MGITDLFLTSTDAAKFIEGQYNYGLVFLSLFVAVCLSLVGLHTAKLARDMEAGKQYQTTIIMAAMALGLGIWSMHFVGMLAFQMPLKVTYNIPVTLVSMVPATGASWLAVFMLSRKQIKIKLLLLSGVLVGAGIGVMHYVGMMAMQTTAMMKFVPSLFALSVVVAVVLAVLALWVDLGLKQTRLPSSLRFILAGIVMGCAITGMHYTGMSAMRFVGQPEAGATINWDGSTVFGAIALAAVAVGVGLIVASVNSLIRSHVLREQLAGSEARLQQQLTEIIGQVEGNVIAVDGVAVQIAEGAGQLHKRIQLQTNNLQQTASSVEEITATVQNTASNAAEADALTTNVRKQADEGRHIIQSAVASMTAIRQASEKITDIVGVIDDIAFQTNLLALNASVEAARAGVHGRGFAVVASEVRKLASNSAESAQAIKSLVVDSAAKVEEGATQVQQSGETFEDIAGAIRRLDDIVAGIASASSQQSSGIELINQSVNEMDGVTQENVTLINELTEGGQTLEQQTSELKEHISDLKAN